MIYGCGVKYNKNNAIITIYIIQVILFLAYCIILIIKDILGAENENISQCA